MENEHLNPDELQHWGIKGMKWGIRRFQNKDGSLTPEGRKRYDDDGDSSASTTSHPKKAPHEMTGKDYKKMRLEDMTDEELAAAINRSRAEQAYKQLNPEPVSKGKVLAEKFINEALIPVTVSAGKNFMDKQLNKIIDKALKDAVPKTELEQLKEAADILKVKKDIADYKDQISKIGKEKEKSVAEQKKEREDQIALDKLNDDDYQARKKASELADMQNKINKVKDGGTFDVDDAGNIKGNNDSKPKTEAKKDAEVETKNEPKSETKSEAKAETKTETVTGEATGKGTSTSKIKQEIDYDKYKEEARNTLQKQLDQIKTDREIRERYERNAEQYVNAIDKMYKGYSKSDTPENNTRLMTPDEKRRYDDAQATIDKLKAVGKIVID